MASEKEEKKLCAICNKEEAFQGGKRFDKCMSCADILRRQKYGVLVSQLPSELRILFDDYHAADQEFASMIILD